MRNRGNQKYFDERSATTYTYNMAIYKKITENNELYLYMKRNLIYKRYLDTGQSKVFDIMAYDKYTLTSIRDLEFENPIGI